MYAVYFVIKVPSIIYTQIRAVNASMHVSSMRFLPALDEFLKSTFEELFWSDQNPIARWEFIASSHFFCKSRVQEKSHKKFSAKANITEVCLFENQVIVLLC